MATSHYPHGLKSLSPGAAKAARACGDVDWAAARLLPFASHTGCEPVHAATTLASATSMHVYSCRFLQAGTGQQHILLLVLLCCCGFLHATNCSQSPPSLLHTPTTIIQRHHHRQDPQAAGRVQGGAP